LKRGDIFWADLVPRSSSEQSGRRPVIIISHDGFNQTPNWHSIIVVPISSSRAQSRRTLTVVPLAKGVATLPDSSVAICHQVTTIDRSKLARQLGSLPADALKMVEHGLKAAMDLE
jgi:mRNA interferase MazF